MTVTVRERVVLREGMDDILLHCRAYFRFVVVSLLRQSTMLRWISERTGVRSERCVLVRASWSDWTKADDKRVLGARRRLVDELGSSGRVLFGYGTVWKEGKREERAIQRRASRIGEMASGVDLRAASLYAWLRSPSEPPIERTSLLTGIERSGRKQEVQSEKSHFSSMRFPASVTTVHAESRDRRARIAG